MIPGWSKKVEKKVGKKSPDGPQMIPGWSNPRMLLARSMQHNVALEGRIAVFAV